MNKLIFLAAFLPGIVWADSPLTSTDFWRAYVVANPSEPAAHLITSANQGAVLTREMMDFLSDPNVSNGAKIALINASFHQGRYYKPGLSPNADAYRTYLEKKYNALINISKPRKNNSQTLIWEVIYGEPRFEAPVFLTPGELLSLGYLMALNDYLQPAEALSPLFVALQKAPKSQAVRIALALTVGNLVMNNNDMASELHELNSYQYQEAPPDFLRKTQNSEVHLSTETRWAYMYSLILPIKNFPPSFASDFPPEALQPILEFYAYYAPSYEKWVKSDDHFRKNLKLFAPDCERELLAPKIWTQRP